MGVTSWPYVRVFKSIHNITFLGTIILTTPYFTSLLFTKELETSLEQFSHLKPATLRAYLLNHFEFAKEGFPTIPLSIHYLFNSISGFSGIASKVDFLRKVSDPIIALKKCPFEAAHVNPKTAPSTFTVSIWCILA